MYLRNFSTIRRTCTYEKKKKIVKIIITKFNEGEYFFVTQNKTKLKNDEHYNTVNFLFS